MCNLLEIQSERQDVKNIFFLGYSMFGEPYMFEGQKHPLVPGDFHFAIEFVDVVEKFWAQGKFKPHPQRVEPGGLLGAVDGMQYMREGKGPSGEKLVYRVDETKWP